MRHILTLGLGVAVICGALLAPAFADHTLPTSKKERAELVRFAANNALFVLYHEVGHLLVDKLNLPVLGREEDAADNLATWVLLKRQTAAADQALIDAAQGWLLSGIAYSSEPDDEDYSAAHSLDRQRAFQIVCLMVGSNDQAFRAVADEYAIGRWRQESCGNDYRLVDRSLTGLVGTRATKTGRSSVVDVSYESPRGPYRFAAEAFKASGVIEEVADEVRSKYRIRGKVQFTAEYCGEANAFYDPDEVEITFCYELMQDFMDLYAARNLGTGAAGPGPGKDKTGKF